FKRSLGAMMNLTQQSFRREGDTRNINHADGLSIALSENFLNQALMVSYQSGEFINKEEPALDLSQYGLDKNLTKATVDAQAQPFLKLLPNNQVMLYVDNVYIELSYNNSTAIWGHIDVEMLLEISAKGNKPALNPVEDGVYIGNISAINSSDELKELITAYELLEKLRGNEVDIDEKIILVQVLPAEIEKMVGELGDELFNQLDTINVQVDVGDLVTGDLSSILTQPKTFQLVLSGDGVVVDADQTGIILKGELLEKSAQNDEFSLLDITFCQEVAEEGVPEVCLKEADE
ncbi:MAG: hypothetical protein OXE99_05820, partial [Cellvibrionales bacterium]|nr:hypothetical protein [Cellvibrionales bacterium]